MSEVSQAVQEQIYVKVAELISANFPQEPIYKNNIDISLEPVEDEPGAFEGEVNYTPYNHGIIAYLTFDVSVDADGKVWLVGFEENSDSLTLTNGAWFKDKSGTADPLVA